VAGTNIKSALTTSASGTAGASQDRSALLRWRVSRQDRTACR
jgi:hypothetical protein